MESLMGKLHFYDVFAKFIPGTMVVILGYFKLVLMEQITLASVTIADCIIFVVVGYVIGVVLHELSLICDGCLFNKMAFGGRPREVFLLKENYKKIFADDISYYNALQVKDYIMETIKMNDWIKPEQYDDKELNSFIYSSCLNMSEMKRISWKADKMGAISDLCRTLCMGLWVMSVLYIVGSICSQKVELVVVGLVLIFVSWILWHRKKRHEQLRIRILFRTFWLYLAQEKLI